MSRRGLAILDFDVECLPGHWIGGDFTSKVITAVAWSWEHGKKVTVMTHYDYTVSEMAESLTYVINMADVVTGHYIRAFDLPLLNGTLLREQLPPLGPVITSDTKSDLLKAHGRSKSQENLAAMLGVEAPKIQVTNYDWECFNTRMPGYQKIGVERVKGDVIQHKQLRQKLLDLGYLGPVRRWEP